MSDRDKITGRDAKGDKRLGNDGRAKAAIRAENAKPYGQSQAANEIARRAKAGGHKTTDHKAADAKRLGRYGKGGKR